MPTMPLSGSNDKMNSSDQVDANTGKWRLCCDYCQVVSHFKILSLLRPILISEILKCGGGGGGNEPYQWNLLICAHLVGELDLPTILRVFIHSFIHRVIHFVKLQTSKADDESWQNGPSERANKEVVRSVASGSVGLHMKGLWEGQSFYL